MRNALPSIIGVLLASVIVILGTHLLVERRLTSWVRDITATVAPGQQADNELAMAAADFTRAALLARDRADRVGGAAYALRAAADRYDRWASGARIDGIVPTRPVVARFEARTLAALGRADVARELDAAGDDLTAFMRANSAAAAADAARARDRFIRIQAMGRWVHLTLFLLVASACTALVLVALRREERVCAREAEVARRIDETNADLEAFAGRIAHDLRNPLVPILTGSQIIAHTAAEARVREMGERIERGARRLAGMIDTLLNFSRLTQARAGAASDVCAIIREVLDGFRERAEAEGVRLSVDCAPLSAACEPIVLTSALQNLVENAIKYGHRPDREPVVEVRAYRRRGEAVVEVEDHGPGISAAEAEALFQPFRRGAQAGEGVGLGLATARRLVEARGGHIRLRRGRVGGALFEVVLPEDEGAVRAQRSSRDRSLRDARADP